MLYWTLQITIISIVLVFLVHYLIDFFKSTLTVPKIKDLVNAPTQKYENIYKIISQKNDDLDLSGKKDYSEIDLLPKPNVDIMKNELKSFLKEQLNNATKNENSKSEFIYDMPSFDSKQNFSEYSSY